MSIDRAAPFISETAPEFSYDEKSGTLFLAGTWTLSFADTLAKALRKKGGKQLAPKAVDGQKITNFDTTGALFLIKATPTNPQLLNFNPKQLALIALLRERYQGPLPKPGSNRLPLFADIGLRSYALWHEISGFSSFIGQTSISFGQCFVNPRKFRLKEFADQLNATLVTALPIISLVVALIGVVITYLFSLQLAKYGANVFVVDGVALAMTRELAPMIVAITVAGRSGSAFTAQIGTMKLNEEIDALTTLGLSPTQLLVVPRLLGLALALPLLTFVGDAIGISAGAVISRYYLDLPETAFYSRLFSNFPLNSFFLGLAKAPVFALAIALIGCRLGFTCENNALSVGQQTTRTVVLSIVAVIILDALFAVLFAHVSFY